MTPKERNETPSDVEAAMHATIAVDYPGKEYRLRLCSSEPSRFVFRVYFSVPGLKPSPYTIYTFDKTTRGVTELQGDIASPYRIANYK
jgi:hypothetical protein